MPFNLSTITQPVNNKNFRECMDFFTEQKLSARSAAFDREWEKAAQKAVRIQTSSRNAGKTANAGNKNERYLRRENARVLRAGRLNSCGRRLVVRKNEEGRNKSSVHQFAQVYKHPERKTISFGGLMSCGSVWECPVCASKISEGRRNELKEAIRRWEEKNNTELLLTLTIPHYKRDTCKEVTDGLNNAARRFYNSRGFKQVAQNMGLAGRIKTLEVTYGENGWHTHTHTLIFIYGKISDKEIETIKQALLLQWQAACFSAGLPVPNEHGLDLVAGNKAAAYVSKWGIEEEMTKGHLKKGKKEGHVSPFGLLDLYADGDKKAGELFVEYCEAFKGKRQLTWTRGLREKIGLEKEKTEAEILNKPEEESELFISVISHTWDKIIRSNRLLEFIGVCERGTKEDAQKWLDDLEWKEKVWRMHNKNALRQAGLVIQ